MTVSLAGVMFCGALACAPPQARTASQKKEISGKEKTMTTDLAQQIAAKDFGALDTTRLMGQQAIPSVEQAMKNKDGEVRELAVMCLNEIPGGAPARLLVRALDDPYVAIPLRASAYLLEHHSPDILPDLFRHLDDHADESVRARVALAIGAIGDESAVPELRRRVEQPLPPAIARNVRLALARLRQEPFLTDYLAELRAEDWKARLQALRDFEYLNRPDLVRRLAPLLDDPTPVGNVGAPPAKEIVRICDIAVVVIAKVAKPGLRFEARHQRIFNDREIQEVRAALARL